ncbi:2-C-methyl-D-erythritol 2,4-cyclodiphosphate synthase [Persephonella hydrogeniphila]|uniref:2-C-methyl-D-erythritol 2,4-cyclodiphosphate synthase n=1 Tax=Persephonella hydrogeniphila TaxID=198703 RepID=A0A285N1S5_9AQUI|nr:2-C-methyl-D-erythritol 2,4-cyclodiphosphate synthase [Persephonella hydrogeniphila]SNZ03390.1 2-C-methyl-D-erythritol 2,4-cyclodiphosphate synthase [Persephonella hydrogeniphila]
MFRVGIGFDIHRLEKGKKLVIGGVEIPSEYGFKAHSDGDIFFHALTDALLGAVGYGDIGQLFPDTERKWENTPSRVFLEEANRIINEKGYSVLNIDGFIVIQRPKILPYREKIIQNTAEILNIEPERVFIKGKTYEKIGEVGEGKAAFAEVVVLLKKEVKNEND